MGNRMRIAINTGGGDAPGLNAVICGAVNAALNRGWRCFGIRDGYNGLMFPEQFPAGGLVPLTRERVEGITSLGGFVANLGGFGTAPGQLRVPIDAAADPFGQGVGKDLVAADDKYPVAGIGSGIHGQGPYVVR